MLSMKNLRSYPQKISLIGRLFRPASGQVMALRGGAGTYPGFPFGCGPGQEWAAHQIRNYKDARLRKCTATLRASALRS